MKKEPSLKTIKPTRRVRAFGLAGLLAMMLMAGNGWSADPVILRQQSPPSLRLVPIPEPANLVEYVVDRTAAIALGKALFWDMQVGSDGVQACGTCHFHAGADSRTKNQVGPGLNAGDNTFQVGGTERDARVLPFSLPSEAQPGFSEFAYYKRL